LIFASFVQVIPSRECTFRLKEQARMRIISKLINARA
jgi:hypothetical protein